MLFKNPVLTSCMHVLPIKMDLPQQKTAWFGILCFVFTLLLTDISPQVLQGHPSPEQALFKIPTFGNLGGSPVSSECPLGDLRNHVHSPISMHVPSPHLVDNTTQFWLCVPLVCESGSRRKQEANSHSPPNNPHLLNVYCVPESILTCCIMLVDLKLLLGKVNAVFSM